MLPLAFWRIALVINRKPATYDQHLRVVDDIRATTAVSDFRRTLTTKGLDPSKRWKTKDVNVVESWRFTETVSTVKIAIASQHLSFRTAHCVYKGSAYTVILVVCYVLKHFFSDPGQHKSNLWGFCDLLSCASTASSPCGRFPPTSIASSKGTAGT
jgi:hypothetical protein